MGRNRAAVRRFGHGGGCRGQVRHSRDAKPGET
jgi:hypothetical protein